MLYEYQARQLTEIAVVWGFRDEEQQMATFYAGNSSKVWPDSRHNKTDESGEPMSHAFDFAPWIYLPKRDKFGIPWNDTHAFAIVGGMFLGVAAEMNIKLRYGGDWDGDGGTRDQRLMDWGHLELVP